MRFGDNDRAGRAQVFGQRGLIGRHQMFESKRTTGGAHVRGLDIVLQRNRDAVQRPAYAAVRALAVQSIGFLERMGIDRDRGVKLVLISGDSGKILQHQLARGDALSRQRFADLRDGRLYDAEPWRASVSGRETQYEQPCEKPAPPHLDTPSPQATGHTDRERETRPVS